MAEEKRPQFQLRKESTLADHLKKAADAVRERLGIGDDFEFESMKMLEAEVADEAKRCTNVLGAMPVKELLGQANHNFLHYWLAEPSEEVDADLAWEALKKQYLREHGDPLRPLLERLDAIRRTGKGK